MLGIKSVTLNTRIDSFVKSLKYLIILIGYRKWSGIQGFPVKIDGIFDKGSSVFFVIFKDFTRILDPLNPSFRYHRSTKFGYEPFLRNHIYLSLL